MCGTSNGIVDVLSPCAPRIVNQDGFPDGGVLVYWRTRKAPGGIGPVTTQSLYEEGLREAERHKWIESQKLGHDMGESALRDWYRRYWFRYCRSKRLEHLTGSRSWQEFGTEDFGLIGTLLREGDLLLDMILDRAYYGMENLDIIRWAFDWGLPMDRVISILEQLDLNRARLEPSGPPRFAQPNSARKM